MPADGKHAPVTIVERRDHTPDLWSIRVRHDDPFQFSPGQYATLGVPRGEKLVERAYSIVSDPAEDTIEFFFELVPDGALTPLIYEKGVGDELLMRKRAKGLFVLDPREERTHHLLVSTVTGVAPYVSMVRTTRRELAADPAKAAPHLLLIQAGSRSEELSYLDELRAQDAELPWLTYIPSVSRPWEDPDWTGELGRAEDVVRKHADGFGATPQNAVAYLCGHPEMIATVRGIMRRCGFEHKDVREELYFQPGKPEKRIAPVTAAAATA
ncbi:MAG TPA: ferredoxin--NADP reductase [Candidatus Angelobacter sp.]|jgi:ferredoxin--NADP+ reductase|nr:ferredoxin--NADP reductase [Candidatus Angelobacter sp.]